MVNGKELISHQIVIDEYMRLEWKIPCQHDRVPDYVDDFRWDYVRKAMHRLRQATKLFIVSVRNPDGHFEFFVPTTHDEANLYVIALEKNIARQRSMQRKTIQSVDEGWHRVDWVEDNKMLKDYQESLEEKPKQVKFVAKN